MARALTAQVPLKAGQEILVNYQMTLAKSPEWYRVIWLQHMRKTKKGDDSAIQRSVLGLLSSSPGHLMLQVH